MKRSLAVMLLGALCFVDAHAQRTPVSARKGVVTSAHVLASKAGVHVLQQGGNAVDAAVAVGAALAVVYPRAGNLGGGGFMIIARSDGSVTAIDFRETAPAAAKPDMFLDADGNVVPERSVQSPLSVGTPGTVAGLAFAMEKYGSGRVRWAEALAPARQLAEEGVPVSAALARDLRASSPLLEKHAESRRIYLGGDTPLVEGVRFRQPELAATFARLQEKGPREFYEGETARRIVEEMERSGGIITAKDLQNYRAVERTPLLGQYRGFEIVTMPPPSSGGVALLQILGSVEAHDVRALGHASAAKIHLFVEAMRRAFRDRAEYLADPDFAAVPTAALIDPAYIRGRMKDFDPQHATASSATGPGNLGSAGPSAPTAPAVRKESTETTHFSIIDAEGNAVSCTYTLNGLFGSGITVPGTGILLNNEMDDFTAKVGVKNMYGLLQGEINAIAPGKRPVSSIAPTIVRKNGKTVLLIGSPGGPTIITTVLQVLTNVIDHEMSITQAVDAPRFHHQWMPDVVNHEPFLASPDTLALLRAKGHTLALRKLYANQPDAAGRYWGDAESISVDPETGVRHAAPDQRNPDSGAAVQE